MAHKPQVGDAASGVARIIDEADATQDRQIQAQRFADAERDLWDLIAAMQSYWVDEGMVDDNPAKFSDAFDISVRFGDQKPIVSDREQIDTVALHVQNGLMTTRQAIRKLYPEFTDEEVDAWVAELEKERASNAAKSQATTGQGPQGDQGSGHAPTSGANGSQSNSGPDSAGDGSSVTRGAY